MPSPASENRETCPTSLLAQWAHENANNSNYDPGIVIYSVAPTVVHIREKQDLHEASVGLISLCLPPSVVQMM